MIWRPKTQTEKLPAQPDKWTPRTENERVFADLKGVYTKQQLLADYGSPGCLLDQRASEFRMLLEIYKSLRPATILEIGTHQGGTLYYWLKYARPGAKVISLDINHERLGNKPVDWGFGEVELLIKTGDSGAQETFDYVKSVMPQIDFLFIDGNHFLPTVRTDFDWYGGISKLIAMHDINYGGNVAAPQDVRKVWDQIKQTHVTEEFVELPPTSRACYGIGVVYGQQPCAVG